MANDIDTHDTQVSRMNVDNITMANGGTTEGTKTIGFNGIIGTICVKLPDSTNGVTATLSIRDADGFELYSKAAIADNGNTIVSDLSILVAGTVTIGLTASGDPGADWTSTNIVFYAV